jgi:hypothetical protein
LKTLRNNIQVTSLKAPFWKVSRLGAFFSLLLVTSCNFVGDSAERFVDMYQNYSPVKMNAYNYETNEKVSWKVSGFEDMKFKVSTDEFYMSKTLTFTYDDIEKGRAFRESETRREKERYLTLR